MKRFVSPISVPVTLGLALLFAATFLPAAEPTPAQRAKDARIVQALLQLAEVNLAEKPAAKEALLRYLETQKGTEKYVELVSRFQIVEAKDELLRLAIEDSEGTLGVEAAKLLLKMGQQEAVTALLTGEDSTQASKLITALRLSGDPKANALLLPLVTNSEAPSALRTSSVTAIGANLPGQKELLAIVVAEKLLPEQRFAAANALLTSTDEAIKTEAAKYLQLPATADSKPLPPVSELVKQLGNIDQGKIVFQTIGTCAKCHKVKGEGKEVGPDLSEIGTKLPKEALYVSILDPSAGISHNYETHVLILEDGTTVSGIIVSETAEEVAIKTIEAIVRKIPHDEIMLKKKLNTSIMPADLQKVLTAQNLVDVVEYLTTLKKTGP